MAPLKLLRKKNLFVKFAAALILANIFCVSLAFAQAETTPAPETTPSSTPASTPAAEGSCESIDNPNPNSSYIVTTIVEEEITAPPATGSQGAGTIIKTCFRQTTCTGGKCNSQYVTTCTPNGTASDPSYVTCQRVQAIFSQTGSALLFSYISLIYRWAAGTIGIVSVLFLVWGGIEISTAGDNTGKIDRGQKKDNSVHQRSDSALSFGGDSLHDQSQFLHLIKWEKAP